MGSAGLMAPEMGLGQPTQVLRGLSLPLPLRSDAGKLLAYNLTELITTSSASTQARTE